MRVAAASLAVLVMLLAMAPPAAPLGVAAGAPAANVFVGMLAEGDIDRYPLGAAVRAQPLCILQVIGESTLVFALHGAPGDAAVVWTYDWNGGSPVRVPHLVTAEEPVLVVSTMDFTSGCPAFDVEATRASFGAVAYTAVALL